MITSRESDEETTVDRAGDAATHDWGPDFIAQRLEKEGVRRRGMMMRGEGEFKQDEGVRNRGADGDFGRVDGGILVIVAERVMRF